MELLESEYAYKAKTPRSYRRACFWISLLLVLEKLLLDKFEEYNISGSVRMITDSNSIIQAIANFIGIKWLPYYYYVVNLLLLEFISLLTDQFGAIMNLQDELSRNIIFRQFCKQHNSKRITILFN